jgi:SAM-dependent methyltransferase
MVADPDRNQRRVRDTLRRRGPTGTDVQIKEGRDSLTLRFLGGHGVEVGALNYPVAIPPGAQVTYVDYLPAEELRAHHPWLVDGFVEPDVVDDGETLSTFADDSLDFIVANHFIEHAEDPIATIANHLEKLRSNGILFYAVPDKRLTDDRDRPLTSIEHLRRDHDEGPEVSRAEHYREWARFVDRVPQSEVDATAEDYAARRFSIHFHVWDPTSFVEFLANGHAHEGLDFEIEHLECHSVEFVVVLRKQSRLNPDSDQAARELGALRRENFRLNSRLQWRRYKKADRLAMATEGPRRWAKRARDAIGRRRRG